MDATSRAFAALKWNHDWEGVNETLARIRADKQLRPFKGWWVEPCQTPPVYVTHLRARPVWETGDEVVLKRAAGIIKEALETARAELREFQANRHSTNFFKDEFKHRPDLVVRGEWFRWALYSTGKWNDNFCSGAWQKTCKALADVLPGAKNGLPLVLGNTEEIVVTGMAPDTKIRTHASDSNTRLTLIAGLQGFAISTIKIYYKGAVMEVMGKAWNQKGVATIIDDSFDHEFQTEPGIVTASSGGTEVDEYSYVLEVSVMHPDLVNYPGRFAEAINKKTDFASAWKGERHREFLDAKNRTGPHPHLDPEDPSRFKAGMREAHEKARAIKLAKTKPFKPDPPKKALKIVGSTVEMSPAR